MLFFKNNPLVSGAKTRSNLFRFRRLLFDTIQNLIAYKVLLVTCRLNHERHNVIISRNAVVLSNSPPTCTLNHFDNPEQQNYATFKIIED